MYFFNKICIISLQNLLVAVFTLFVSIQVKAQDTYIPLNSDKYHLIDRYEIKYGKMADGFHSSSKPYPRKAVVNLADSLLTSADEKINLSKNDKYNLAYLVGENWEWASDSSYISNKAILKTFYTAKADLYSYKDENFSLHVNPVIGISAGKDNTAADYRYLNTRGIEVRGIIGKKVGFYTYMADNQALFPTYAIDYINKYNAVPGEGFVKSFKGTLGKDFFTSRGYFTFSPVKFINVQFGNDRNFVGNGYRSLILSDNAKDYLFLKINTKVWKFNYQNLFAQMVYSYDGHPNRLYPTKFVAFHHLSLNIGKRLNVGVYEAIPFGRFSGFDLTYMNPIIFYRAAESHIGSKDNAILGADFKLNLARKFSFYGQFVLDEFILGNILARNGWWANKQGFQLGGKYIDAFGIKNLDLQGEINYVRPYTYTHASNSTSFTHYNQSLVHPLGANFREAIGIIRYQPIEKLFITAKLMYYQYGTDTAKSNWGGNILLDYRTRPYEYGNKVAQGVRVNTLFADLTISYQIRYNMFIDLKQIIRQAKSASALYNMNTTYTALTLRMNMPQRLHEF